MKFSLNQFLLAVSSALDFVEIDIAGRRTKHGKRVAYMALRIAMELKFDNEDLYDIVSFAILHDNGISEAKNNVLIDNINTEEYRREHCIIGENNIINYPFINNHKNIIKYHHEKYNGTGFYKLKGEQIPLISQIICFCDYLENEFPIHKIWGQNKIKIKKFVEEQRGKLFNPQICEIFLRLTENIGFILDLNEECIDYVLMQYVPHFTLELSLEEIAIFTSVFSKIIDSKSKFTMKHSSGIAEKAGIMAEYYKYQSEEKTKFIISANLHDLGKLAIPNSILDSPNKLADEEFDIIKTHTYYTRAALSKIDGFEDITEWASNHHEKLNGIGYPYGKIANELDFNSRLMGCIDIYQALTEKRPYRKPLSHKKAMEIMREMAKQGFIDGNRVEDVNVVFS